MRFVSVVQQVLYVAPLQRDLSDVLITRVMRGADGSTDHRMLRSKLKLTLEPAKRCEAPRTRKINVRALAGETADEY